jgi:hypothetical protein
MKKRVVDLRGDGPILDIVSYGRAGPARLTRAQLEVIALTVRRAPEVMVKVSGGARTLAGVEQGLRYLGRDGKLSLESDAGYLLGVKGFDADVVRDWNLDLEAHRRQTLRAVRTHRKPLKLVHNLVFSMPPGTPPESVLKALRKFTEKAFGEMYRHAMVLHTDERHPHVHVVVKATSEDGRRLYIRKPTLRTWRQQFAENLRELGVSANATERVVRGQTKRSKRDGIYRAVQRGDSTYLRALTRKARADMARGVMDSGMVELLATRRNVVAGWQALGTHLRGAGYFELADRVDRFVERMPPVRTDREALNDQYRTAAMNPDRPPRVR